MIEIFGIIGFLLAAYAVVSNDSIQTLGTFLASNRNVKWYYLWGFISSILVATFLYSWFQYGGDVSFGRLEEIPYIEPQWYHALAPLALLFLTRIKIPVSTSLLVLSAFSSALIFEKILLKSAIGYAVASVVAYILWILIRDWDKTSKDLSKEKEKGWRVLQWLSTGFLWYTWLSHDVANITVFLPRVLNVYMLIMVLVVFIVGLAFSFYNRGGKIQELVLSKTNTGYIRSATIIDIVYAIILLVFKEWSSIPMSTTWVFIGLLTGRELAIHSFSSNDSEENAESKKKLKTVFPLVGKDFLRLLFGLGVSIIIALLIQKVFINL